MKRLLLVLSFLFLTACSAGNDRPVISFIGVATGSLSTDLNRLHFQTQFTAMQRSIVAVVGFAHIKQGTTVQATWFSPDDRHMPLGRTSIVTESGATVTRFSFASTKDWQPAPYMLQIDAMTQNGNTQATGTGSLQFFIGMNDADIAAYQADYAGWKQADVAERVAWDHDRQVEQALLDHVRTTLGFPSISIVEKQDVVGDAAPEYVVNDAKDLPGPQAQQGVLLSAAVHQAAIINQSGSVILSIRQIGGKRQVESAGKTLINDLPQEGDIQMTIIPSRLLSLSWVDGKKQCYADIHSSDTGYVLQNRGCL